MNLSQYVGAPWQERGCWELLRRVYLEQLGVTLPTYAAQYDASDQHKVGELIIAESSAWLAVPIEQERPGDAALFHVAGEPAHVGVVAGRGRFLHIRMGQTAVIESYRGPIWRRRLRGFFRHAELA